MDKAVVFIDGGYLAHILKDLFGGRGSILAHYPKSYAMVWKD
jgi:hypothetical protein